MQFVQTETCKNLARSFAGESQAGMRYQLVAKAAMKENLKTLADAIRTIAKNETYHAKRFFEMLQEKGGGKDNIGLDAGYPFHGGTLEDGLRFAAMDEKSEFTEIYPKFAETAEQEGFKDIAALYRLVADVEKQHNIIFNYLYEAVKNGTLYKNDSPILWVCSECGYMHVATEAWKICPLCQAEQGYVELHLPFEGVRV